MAELAQSSLGYDINIPIYHDGENASTSLDALLSRTDISAVVIALPINVQPEMIIRALQAGKHVLSEKPVAPDVETATRLIKAYEDQYKVKGLVWKVAENYEIEPAIIVAKWVLLIPV